MHLACKSSYHKIHLECKSNYHEGNIVMLLQEIHRIASLLNPNLPWEPPYTSYHDQASLQYIIKINMGELAYSIQNNHGIHRPKLPWVIQLKLPWIIQLKLPWDSATQATMRFSISNFHETQNLKLPWMIRA